MASIRNVQQWLQPFLQSNFTPGYFFIFVTSESICSCTVRIIFTAKILFRLAKSFRRTSLSCFSMIAESSDCSAGVRSSMGLNPNVYGVEHHPRSAGNSMTAGFGAGIARTSGAKSRAARAMTLQRPVRRCERRPVKKTIEPDAPHRKNPLGLDVFVAERLSLRPHQRRYAALPTALRCIASLPGLYEEGSMGA